MMQKLLFVTRGGENYKEGLSYALYLAKTLNSSIAILIVHNRNLLESCEDAMAAAAFAEAGEFKTAKEILKEQAEELRSLSIKNIMGIAAEKGATSVDLTCDTAMGDTVSAVKNFLKDAPNINMVLLSPSLSNRKKGKELKKLIKNISKPIVAISRQLQTNPA